MSGELTREQVVDICRLFSARDYGQGHVDVLLAHDHALRDRLAQAERENQDAKRLQAQLATAQAEAVDTVPRTRYDACNQDWLNALAELQRVRGVAKAEIESLQAQLATAQARIERLEGAVRAMRDARLAYWRRAADEAGDPADDATALRDAAKYDALFQICEQALADAPFTGEAKHE